MQSASDLVLDLMAVEHSRMRMMKVYRESADGSLTQVGCQISVSVGDVGSPWPRASLGSSGGTDAKGAICTDALPREGPRKSR
jgi:hypothetical protein